MHIVATGMHAAGELAGMRKRILFAHRQCVHVCTQTDAARAVPCFQYADHPMPAGDYVPVALMKLFIHPLVVLAVGTGAVQLGVPLDPFALTVMVLIAALPSASNVSLLAERYGADNGRIARIILVSTVLAFFTFSGAVAVLWG